MLCTQLFHEKLKSKLFAIVNFAFKVGEKPLIIYPIMIQQNGGGGKKRGLGFSKTTLKTASNYLMENCYVNAGNLKMKRLCNFVSKTIKLLEGIKQQVAKREYSQYSASYFISVCPKGLNVYLEDKQSYFSYIYILHIFILCYIYIYIYIYIYTYLQYLYISYMYICFSVCKFICVFICLGTYLSC